MNDSQLEPSDQERTLCEINCQLVSIKTRSSRLNVHACPDIFLSSGDHAANYLEGHVPTVWVKVWPGHMPRWRLRGVGRQQQEGLMKYLFRRLLSPLPGVRWQLQAATGLQLLRSAPTGPLAWHPRKLLLAAPDAADRIHIYNFSGQVPSLGQPPSAAVPAPLSPSQLLYHEFQKGVAALAWRPNSGGGLAAACARGVFVWRLGGPSVQFGSGPGARPEGAGSGGAADARRTGGGSSAAGWSTWLRPPPGAGPLSCLAWHPRGHLLAAASQQGAGFFVWDVATGVCTPLRAGTEPVSLLSWSPCGSYLLTGHPSGSFRVWQSHSWWPVKWSAAESGSSAQSCPQSAGGLAGAAWSPDSRTLLLAYAAAQQQLVSLHFTQDPPSLQAQLLPLTLPEIAGRANGCSGRAAAVIESVAWDPRGQRLAVAVGGSHPAAGSVALYDTRCDPILSARFIGWVRVGSLAPQAGEAQQQGPSSSGGGAASVGAGPAAHPGLSAGTGSARGEIWEAEGAAVRGAGAGTGPATAAEPLQLCFQPGFGQGSLLSVRRGEFVGTVPLYFSS